MTSDSSSYENRHPGCSSVYLRYHLPSWAVERWSFWQECQLAVMRDAKDESLQMAAADKTCLDCHSSTKDTVSLFWIFAWAYANEAEPFTSNRVLQRNDSTSVGWEQIRDIPRILRWINRFSTLETLSPFEIILRHCTLQSDFKCVET